MSVRIADGARQPVRKPLRYCCLQALIVRFADGFDLIDGTEPRERGVVRPPRLRSSLGGREGGGGSATQNVSGTRRRRIYLIIHKQATRMIAHIGKSQARGVGECV